MADDFCLTVKHQKQVERYKNRNAVDSIDHRFINTYPWPYNDVAFATFVDMNDPETYVLDQSGCPVKDATSYVAYKIYEETGKWPQGTHQNNWQDFLAEAGYKSVMPKPTYGCRFVGIGREGQVVWAEGGEMPGGGVPVSSYVNGRHWTSTVKSGEYLWIKII